VHAVVTVRKATKADARALSATLARAFEDDPVMSWLYPGVRRLEAFFLNYELKLHLGHGDVYTTDGIEGGAIWAPPGHWRTSFADLLRVAPALLRATGTRLARGIGTMRVVEGVHPNEPHWYLATLGTDCHCQGKGIGSALLAPMLERCDAEGLPAYLESSKEANIPFYRRHGFEVTSEVELPKGPKIWPMWREPRPA
jgi:ribosomal protein S18 acetylase RimI-like enzyme